MVNTDLRSLNGGTRKEKKARVVDTALSLQHSDSIETQGRQVLSQKDFAQ